MKRERFSKTKLPKQSMSRTYVGKGGFNASSGGGDSMAEIPEVTNEKKKAYNNDFLDYMKGVVTK